MDIETSQKHRMVTVSIVDSRNPTKTIQFSVHGNAYKFAYEYLDLERDLMLKFEAALEKLRNMI